MRATGADVGLAFDGDADRVFLVDEQGVGLSGSTTTAMLAAMLLDRNPGATVIHNLICSQRGARGRSASTAARRSSSRVGHSFIKARMAETNAIFGGEHSAHYYFRDNYFADSGLIAAIMMLELLSRADAPLSELRKPFERYVRRARSTRASPIRRRRSRRSPQRSRTLRQDRLDGLTVTATRGGSTCARRTPNRCCASTSRPPPEKNARPAPSRSSPS